MGLHRDPIADAGNHSEMKALAGRMRTAIAPVHGVNYTAMQSSQLYPTAGDTTDWTYGVYGIPSLTIELRPSSHTEGGFILPASQIQPTFEENKPAAMEFISSVVGEHVGGGAGVASPRGGQCAGGGPLVP